MYGSTDDRRSRRRCRCSTCVLRLLQLGCELLAREGCATQHEPQQTEDNATQRGTVRTHRFTYIKRNTKLCKWTYPPCCSAIGCHANSDCTLHANACMKKKKIACRRQCIGRTFLQIQPTNRSFRQINVATSSIRSCKHRLPRRALLVLLKSGADGPTRLHFCALRCR
jgi:hypothetical protein